MRIPSPPWYGYLNQKLGDIEWLVDALLLVIIVVCVILLFSKDRVLKTAVAVFLISP